MAGYIGTQAVSVNTTTAISSDDLTVGDDATFSGDLDVDGTTNLDVVDIDGAVNMATTLLVTGAVTTSSTITMDVAASPVFDLIGGDGNSKNIIFKKQTSETEEAKIKVLSNNMTLDVVGDIFLDAGGDIKITDGNIVVANGHGIDFSATGDGAGTDSSELLDDYEEGAWTPTYRQGSNNPAAYATQYGYYTKVGGVVHASGYLTVNGLASMSGTLVISGLPYTIQNLTSGFSSVNIGYYENLNLPTDNTSVMGYADANTVDLNLRIGNNTASSASMTAAQLSANGGMIFSVTYRSA